MQKAVTYVRLRSPKSRPDAAGFENYALTKNVDIIKSFEVGPAEAHTAIEPKSTFSQALDLIADGSAQILLVETLGDISSSPVVQRVIYYIVARHGGRLVAVREPSVCSDVEASAIDASLSFLLHRESAFRLTKLGIARARIRKNAGRCEGRRAYGQASNYRQAQMEQATITRMKQLRGEGLSYDQIAATLNSEEVPPQQGRRWWGKTINLILNRN